MLGMKILLADHFIKLFHRAHSFIVDVLAYRTHVVAFVRRMTLVSSLLTRQSLPTPTIVMYLLSTVRKHYLTLPDSVVPLDQISYFGRLSLLNLKRDPQLKPCTYFVDLSQYPAAGFNVGFATLSFPWIILTSQDGFSCI